MFKRIFFIIRDFLDKFKFIKFVLAGCIATLADLSILFFLTEVVGIWYLFSSVFSFSVGFIVSFLLQKFWTFKDKMSDDLQNQLLKYLFVMGVSLVIGVLSVYFLVDKIGVYYLLGQVLADAFLAIGRYFINKNIIFKHEVSS